MDFIALLIGIIICAIFGVVVYIWSKKDQADLEENLKNLTQEQKEKLINTPYQEAPDCPNGAIVCGMIYEMKKKKTGGFSLYTMYYNTYFPNFKNQIIYMDISISANIAEEHNLKNGDFIKVLVNEDKKPKIIFD